MKKKITALCLMILLTLSYSISAFAAPKTMSDGQLFDAEYYADNNPDVVKALGSTEEALYKHYIEHGKAEGRLPYADAPKPSSSTKTSTSAPAVTNNRASSANQNKTTTTVYITNTGSKYHNAGCRYLKNSKIAIDLADAKEQGYEPCKVCH
ncbi:MAG: hypothetical protein J5509_08295 [Lachnospiraceae bacterium]|nr:hypothetical protein [Lachnospiraceae bacterium]